MISLGNNITTLNDPLRNISTVQLFEMISRSGAELQSLISQLRMVLTLTPEKYRFLKRKLPYFTCGNFHPPYRKTSNFNFIRCFMLDVDHLADKQMNAAEIKMRVSGDPRVLMAFVSPSADGLKIMLRLSENCYDAAKFSLFYKVFAREFSKQHNLEQVIDSRTSDVTRACFLSCDAEAYFKENPEEVAMEHFTDFENQLAIGEAASEMKKMEKEEQAKPGIDEPDAKVPLSGDILQEIKQKLNPRIKTRLEKDVFVPEQLDQVIPLIEEKISGLNIRIKEVHPIQYGKKIVFEVGLFWAEVNLFYGKKGYSVVKTPKRGSNDDLAEIAYRLICEIIYGAG